MEINQEISKLAEIKIKIISLVSGVKVYISCMVTWGQLGFKSVMGTTLRDHRWN